MDRSYNVISKEIAVLYPEYITPVSRYRVRFSPADSKTTDALKAWRLHQTWGSLSVSNSIGRHVMEGDGLIEARNV